MANTRKPQDKKTLDAALEAKSLNAPADLYANIKEKVDKIQKACDALNTMIETANKQNAALKKGSKAAPAAPAAPTKSHSNKL